MVFDGHNCMGANALTADASSQKPARAYQKAHCHALHNYWAPGCDLHPATNARRGSNNSYVGVVKLLIV